MRLITKNQYVKEMKLIILDTLKDMGVQRNIAMDYLVGLKPSELKLFNEAVELRRASEAKLEKLADKAPDIDNDFTMGYKEQ